MKIELSLFLALWLTGWLCMLFIAEFFGSRSILSIKKSLHRKKKMCEVCASVHFSFLSGGFWRCPICGSINKNHDN